MVESSDPFPWADEKKIAKLSRKPFGEDLAESLAAMLCYKAANRRYPDDGIYNHHRDYCGHGLMFFDEAFHLIEVQDGRPRESKILASWRDGAEFVAFWARQSDYSCSGADPDAGPLYSPRRSNRNNQRITRQRIEAFVTAARCPYCNGILRSEAAKQCPECLRDWHDPENVRQLDGPDD